MLDIDTLVAPALLTRRWEEMGLEFVIHSTHSSTLEEPKWRAVFPLAKPVPAGEWKDTYRKLTAHLAGERADEACSDVSRMYYLPSCPKEHEAARFADITRAGLSTPTRCRSRPRRWSRRPRASPTGRREG